MSSTQAAPAPSFAERFGINLKSRSWADSQKYMQKQSVDEDQAVADAARCSDEPVARVMQSDHKALTKSAVALLLLLAAC